VYDANWQTCLTAYASTTGDVTMSRSIVWFIPPNGRSPFNNFLKEVRDWVATDTHGWGLLGLQSVQRAEEYKK